MAIYGSAQDVSADGSVVVGFIRFSFSGDPKAARWDAQAVHTLGNLGGSESHALGVSDNGSVIVGHSEAADGSVKPYRWENNQMVALSTLGHSGVAGAVSADGRVIVGQSNVAPGSPSRLVRWEDEMLHEMGTLPGEWTYSQAEAVSGDGSVVVGWFSFASGGQYEPFIWDATHGIRSLEEVLTDGGIDLTGWDLTYTNDISDDGRVIVGRGTNPSGQIEAWRAVIPEPSTILLLATLAATLALFHLLRRHRN